MEMALTTTYSELRPPEYECVANENATSVSVNLAQGLGVALSLGSGKFGEYLRVMNFPALCERSHVQFAGKCHWKISFSFKTTFDTPISIGKSLNVLYDQVIILT